MKPCGVFMLGGAKAMGDICGAMGMPLNCTAAPCSQAEALCIDLEGTLLIVRLQALFTRCYPSPSAIGLCSDQGC